MHRGGSWVHETTLVYEVFTGQGSSASQMTAPKVMDVIARLPDCDGQTADADSAHTQVKTEDALSLLKIPKSECPDIRIRLPRHNWPKSWSNIEDPVVPLERNLYGHPLAGLLSERQFEKVLSEHGWEKVPNWNVYSLTEKKDYSYLCMWTISIWLGKSCTSVRLGKFSWKTLICENQHHSSTMFIWIALKETVKSARMLWIITEVCSNQRFLPRATGKLTETKATGELDAETISSWSYDMEGHAMKCLERNCEFAKKNDPTILQSRNAMHGWPSVQRRKNKSVRELSLLTNCSEVSVFGSYWETWYIVVSE